MKKIMFIALMVTITTGVYGSEQQLKQGCEQNIEIVRATRQHTHTATKMDKCFRALEQNLRWALENDISNKDLNVDELGKTSVNKEEKAYQNLFDVVNSARPFGGRYEGTLVGNPLREGLVSQWSKSADRSLWLTGDFDKEKEENIKRLYSDFGDTTIKLIEAIITSHTGQSEESSTCLGLDGFSKKIEEYIKNNKDCEVDDSECQVLYFAQDVIKLTDMILNDGENLGFQGMMALCNRKCNYSNCNHSRLLKRSPFFSKEKKLLCLSGSMLFFVVVAVATASSKS